MVTWFAFLSQRKLLMCSRPSTLVLILLRSQCFREVGTKSPLGLSYRSCGMILMVHLARLNASREAGLRGVDACRLVIIYGYAPRQRLPSSGGWAAARVRRVRAPWLCVCWMGRRMRSPRLELREMRGTETTSPRLQWNPQAASSYWSRGTVHFGASWSVSVWLQETRRSCADSLVER